jgi:hypothetical protein
LTATLNPVPTQYQLQQNVTFYYSNLSSASSLTAITGDPVTGLALVGGNGNPALSTALSVNGIATLTFTPQVVGTFYFIAEIVTPT